ncbi:GM19518 [Drosophila sechellia]|uniref:GM19518 n=1 Tax=Drosophila sechellia TaxID=7238 RepID=B4I6B8_DROSE|nr:GM19518 [Drosophila sechellia]
MGWETIYLGQKGRRRISDDDKDAEDNVSPSAISYVFLPNYLPLFLAISSLLSGCGFFLLGVLEAASFWTTSRLLSRVSWQHLT